MQQFTSANTSIRQRTASSGFTSYQKHYGFMPGSRILDYGGGRFDDSAQFMKPFGCRVYVYDPYNRSTEHNRDVMKSMRSSKPEYIVCSNVLNVIKENSVVDTVVRRISMLCKSGTQCIFTVYEGNGRGVGRQTGPDQYQRNEKLKDYAKYIKRYFGDNFVIKYGMIIAWKG